MLNTYPTNWKLSDEERDRRWRKTLAGLQDWVANQASDKDVEMISKFVVESRSRKSVEQVNG